MSQARQRRLKIRTLPANLEEAVREMKRSELLKETLGDHIFNKFIANKEVEITEYKKNVGREYDKQVSEYEISRYLPVL